MTEQSPLDVRERIARIIDPSSWSVFDGYLADVKRKYRGQETAYDPDAFKDKASLAKADEILALSHTGGSDGVREGGEIAAAVDGLVAIHRRLMDEVGSHQADRLTFPLWSEGQAWKDATAIMLAMVELERAKAALTSPAPAGEEDCERQGTFCRLCGYRACMKRPVPNPSPKALRDAERDPDPARRALYMCAAHCQGGHSNAGAAAAEALGADFPLQMDQLVKLARAEGFNPVSLWPWLFRMKPSLFHVKEARAAIRARAAV